MGSLLAVFAPVLAQIGGYGIGQIAIMAGQFRLR